MGRQIVPVTAAATSSLDVPCAACTFWERGPGPAAVPASADKREWLDSTTSDWGRCGWQAEVDGAPVGYVLYAPPGYVPRAHAFPTAPPSPDAVLLMTVQVLPEHRGNGLGRALVRAAAADLVGRGVRAVEAYGTTTEVGCLIPAGFLTEVGFIAVRDHALVPRLRLDLRTTVTWRDDVGGVWARLGGYFGTRSGSRIDPVGVSSSSGR
jgi:GNAT superfamily N-acetyltransferase